jgi:2-amino-4-hydroxy-6-hydroxymethyldihydropteridine diphosphokinase
VTTAFIGLGSNLDDPAEQIRQAIETLRAGVCGRLCVVSPLYGSPPLGPPDQPDYVNAVAELETTLDPLCLLDALQAIEQAQRRQRVRHWGPRTLDLDLLSVDHALWADRRLTLPHPGIAERAFVLVPWADIAPDYRIPGLGRVADLAARLADAPLRRLSAPIIDQGADWAGGSGCGNQG